MSQAKISSRNQVCPCGSGKKYKFCCLKKNTVGQLDDFFEKPNPIVSRLYWMGCCLFLLVAGFMSYHNALSGPFIFDDIRTIVNNTNIHHWDLSKIFSSIRPVVDFSLAMNYKMGALNVEGYHVFNIATHILSSILLMLIVYKTLWTHKLHQAFGQHSLFLAFSSALLWLVHPLQTQAVNYTIQRAELLMAFFYLSALYCFIQMASTKKPIMWGTLSVLALILGMASKAIIITAPIVFALYAWLFFNMRFKQILSRWGSYFLTAVTGMGLCIWKLSQIQRNPAYKISAGFNIDEFTWWEYFLTQTEVVLHYIRLSAWPTGLTIDYSWPIVSNGADVLVPSLVLAGLITWVIWSMFQRQASGFIGAWFFIILIPSSSFIPVIDIAFEHRVYLSLASVVVGAVLLGYRLLGIKLAVAMMILLFPASSWATLERNKVYQSQKALWMDVLEKNKDNTRAMSNLGVALHNENPDQAMEMYRKAIDLNPDHDEARSNLARAYYDRGEYQKSILEFHSILKRQKTNFRAHTNLALVYQQEGEYEKAIEHYLTALAANPSYLEAQVNLGNCYMSLRQFDKAIDQFNQILKRIPMDAEVWTNLAIAHNRKGNPHKAIELLQKAIDINPNLAEAYYNLASAQRDIGLWQDSVNSMLKAIEIKPHFFQAYYALGILYEVKGRVLDAYRNYEKALKVNPDYEDAKKKIEYLSQHIKIN